VQCPWQFSFVVTRRFAATRAPGTKPAPHSRHPEAVTSRTHPRNAGRGCRNACRRAGLTRWRRAGELCDAATPGRRRRYRRRCGPGCRGSDHNGGWCGVLVCAVILDVAHGGPGIQGEGDRRMAQAVRRELLPRADPGSAGQAAHQPPQVTLAEPPTGGGQQGPRQLPPAGHSGAVRPVGQVGIQGRHGGRGERDLRRPGRPCGPPGSPGGRSPRQGRRCRRRRPRRRAGHCAAATAPRPRCPTPGRRRPRRPGRGPGPGPGRSGAPAGRAELQSAICLAIPAGSAEGFEAADLAAGQPYQID